MYFQNITVSELSSLSLFMIKPSVLHIVQVYTLNKTGITKNESMLEIRGKSK